MTFLSIQAHCMDDDFEERIRSEFGVTIKDRKEAPWNVVFEGERDQLIAMYHKYWGMAEEDELLDPVSNSLSEIEPSAVDPRKAL